MDSYSTALKPLFIAEVKIKSPFGFKSNKTWNQLFDIANENGDILSIHTNPLWDGSFDLLYIARKLTDKPILAKGLHRNKEEVLKAFDHGADYVLCYDYIPYEFNPNRIFIEPKDMDSLEHMCLNERYARIPHFNVEELEIEDCRQLSVRVLWNQRNLLNGCKKDVEFDEVLQSYRGWICQGSFIKTIDDVDPRAHAYIVGEHLETFCKTL